MTSPAGTGVTAAQRALADAVVEIERHVATLGWDAPARVFALVSTQAALRAEPGLAAQLPEATVRTALDDPLHLTSVEQDDLPTVDSLEDLLASIVWPDAVAGAAVVVERIVLPPSAEEELPEDPTAALAYLENHPARQDVRLAAAAMRDGSTWCAVRSRANDSDDAVGLGPDLVPGLTQALLSTFE